MGILVDNFKPKHIMRFFEDISSIPRGSGNENQLREYIISVADNETHEWHKDNYGNLMVVVAATEGCENAPPILFQSHLDMIEVKTKDSNHDFTIDPIELIVKGDIVSANRTTLGADNAVGIVNMLALMVDKTVEHPKLELLFTVEEETGLVGIREFDFGKIKSRRMINMDAGDHETMCVSCAGSTYCSVFLPINRVPMIDEAYHINISGLTGGHAGLEIGLGRASAIKLMSRVLNRIRDSFDINIISMSRKKHNSIADLSDCLISAMDKDIKGICDLIKLLELELLKEFFDTDPNLSIRFNKEEIANVEMLDKESTSSVIDLVYLFPFGTTKRLNSEFNTILCSSNIDGVEMTKEEFVLYSQLRSSVDDYKAELFRKVKVVTRLCGASIEITDNFTGWPYYGENDFQLMSKQVFKDLFSKDVKIEKSNSCAEPAIIVGAIPDMEAIGMAPFSKGAHTTEEYMDASTFLPFWNFLKALLRESCKID